MSVLGANIPPDGGVTTLDRILAARTGETIVEVSESYGANLPKTVKMKDIDGTPKITTKEAIPKEGQTHEKT